MNQKELKKYFEKVIDSKEFRSSKMDRSLFEYLFQAQLNTENIDEYAIARDVFERGEEFNPAEDTIVRVHKYSLRKKLEVYYLSAGKNDTVHFHIPKGEYRLIFQDKGEKTPEISRPVSAKYYTIALIVVSFLFITLIPYFYFSMRSIDNKYNDFPHINKNNNIWRDFLSDELPLLIVLGNHFTFQEENEQYQRIRTIRDTQINSDSDLQEFISEFKADNISVKSNRTYFPFHSVWGLVPLLNLSFSNEVNPIIKESSGIVPESLENNNTIFIGSLKTLFHFEYILAQSNLSYQLNPHKIIYSSPENSINKEFEKSIESSFPSNDLGIAIKVPGPTNSSVFLIASFASIGVPSILEYLMSESAENELTKMLDKTDNKFPQYFEIVFRITGIDKTAYRIEILICNELGNH